MYIYDLQNQQLDTLSFFFKKKNMYRTVNLNLWNTLV